MTATDLAYAREEEAADSGFGHWVAVRRGVLVLYFISLGVWTAYYGIPVQRELVVAWVCGGLACASLGRRDFVEGIRAQVIDKDRAPRWRPPTLDELDTEQVAAQFIAYLSVAEGRQSSR